VIDEASIAIGQIVIGIAIAFGFAHLALHSPRFRWFAETFVLVAWLVITVALPLVYGLTRLPDVWWSAACIVTALALFLIWRSIGLPALRRQWRLRRFYRRMWE
jgi:hypothetical protein